MGQSSSALLLGLRRRAGKERQGAVKGNTPDVIEAHERYGVEPRPPARPSVSVLYSYSAPRTPAASLQDQDRKLPTQHRHPVRVEHRGTSPSPSHARRHPHPHHHRRCSRSRPRPSRHRTSRGGFGYDIQDVDSFLANASLQSPANIPMVLSRESVLYRTREGGWQEEVPLPLGMVVNGVFLVSGWLYAQTPHGHEGYVSYSACIPLGILPHRDRDGPCWDTASDVFPAPSGNRTDTDKLGSDSERSFEANTTSSGRAAEVERHLDALFLRATAATAQRPLGPHKWQAAVAAL